MNEANVLAIHLQHLKFLSAVVLRLLQMPVAHCANQNDAAQPKKKKKKNQTKTPQKVALAPFHSSHLCLAQRLGLVWYVVRRKYRHGHELHSVIH
jgi:hypothetical protein